MVKPQNAALAPTLAPTMAPGAAPATPATTGTLLQLPMGADGKVKGRHVGKEGTFRYAQMRDAQGNLRILIEATITPADIALHLTGHGKQKEANPRNVGTSFLQYVEEVYDVRLQDEEGNPLTVPNPHDPTQLRDVLLTFNLKSSRSPVSQGELRVIHADMAAGPVANRPAKVLAPTK